MRVIITEISRSVIQMHVDKNHVEVNPGAEYTICFIIHSDGSAMRSELKTVHDGNMSFSEAELIVWSKLQ